MATYYFDTSATVKRYVAEPGTAEIDEVLDATPRGRSRHTVAFVSVGIVEVVAAFSRLERMGAITALQWNELATQFSADLSSRYLALEVTKPIVQEASALTRRRGLRGYDAVHLASAMGWMGAMGAPVTLATFDRQLWDATVAEGVAVLPEARP